jgi:YVTN family beta-propeller protein
MLILTLVALVSWPCSSFASAPDYHSVGEIQIGGAGGWDYLSVDPGSHRLFISHSDRIVVADTTKNVVIKEIPGTPGIHGIAIASDLKKAFSSDGKEGKVGVIDLESLSIKGKIAVGEGPDAILYEPLKQEVYSFNGKSHSASVIDAKAEKVVATIDLPGRPEEGASDGELGRVFVNIEDKAELVVIDTSRHAVSATWPLVGCESPSGLAIDSKNHRLFSVCENEKMLMIDAGSGKILGSVPTGQGTDGAGFAPGLGLAFSSNGRSATVTVAHEESPDQLAVAQSLKTEFGARTMAVDRVRGVIYLPTAKVLSAEKGKRPKFAEGTMKILVYAPGGDKGSSQ